MGLTGIFRAWAQHRADRRAFERQIARQLFMLDSRKIVSKDAFDLCCFPNGYANVLPSSFPEKQFDKHEWGAMAGYNRKIASGEEQAYPIPARYIPEPVRQSVERYAPDKEFYDGALLDTVLDSWNAVAWNGRFLDTLGRRAFEKGEGQAMIDFWTAVNALDDYSHLFPGGGKKQKDRGRRAASFAASPVFCP